MNAARKKAEAAGIKNITKGFYWNFNYRITAKSKRLKRSFLFGFFLH